MEGAIRIIPSQPLAALAPKTASGGKNRASRFATVRSTDNSLKRLGKTRRCPESRAGHRILANTIGNLVAGGIAQANSTTGANGNGDAATLAPAPSNASIPPAILAAENEQFQFAPVDLSISGGTGEANAVGVTVSPSDLTLLTRASSSLLDTVNANNAIISAEWLNGGSPSSAVLQAFQTNAIAAAYYGASPITVSQIQSGVYISTTDAFRIDVVPETGSSVLAGTGAYFGGSAELGVVRDTGDYTSGIGLAGQVQYSAVHLGDGQNAVFAATGGFYKAGGYQSSALAENGTVFGASVGVGGGLVFTNAKTISDYSGPATVNNYNIGPPAISYSANTSGIRTLNIGESFGIGYSYSSYNTNTTFKGITK